MPTFSAYDGTMLACHASGTGPALVCLPGGPMRASVYLGDLGGLPAHRRLIRLDLRGTGESALPDDPASYRCERLVADVEALREHLGLERLDLLGHSAGANLAAMYAARHPERVGRLVLVTPSVRAVGIAIDTDLRLRTAELRKGEQWFPAAFAALEELMAGRQSEELWQTAAPFFHGRWDAAARALHAADEEQTNGAAEAVFTQESAFDPADTRAGLARFGGSVLLLAGEVDLNTPPSAVAEYAGLFPHAELVVQPGAGHYPWLDDPERFTASVAGFLG
ncbi:alpha/beta fold hydrolase [Actinacidiphila acididurans]|uniref:Alpha/beta hydrolase n=1 Tax=Actinacidiphila acididurans TaxID=2784346 RepID=A0ABS2TLU5_9ACTN|nr:alpha/beta hydrolase [Actinacidiphila acididurans]MBM9504309.1 alpha/beta hydrolase [Actinacidiphila acididurans]